MTTATAAKAEELAQAAFDLFCSRGIDRVNLDEIAAAAGVTKGSLYWHYASKKEVVLAACDLYYARWREQIGAATGDAETAYGKLEAAIAYSVRSCLLDEANRVFSTEIVALSLYDTEVRASWAGFLDETERFFLGLTHQAVGRGELHLRRRRSRRGPDARRHGRHQADGAVPAPDLRAPERAAHRPAADVAARHARISAPGLGHASGARRRLGGHELLDDRAGRRACGGADGARGGGAG